MKFPKVGDRIKGSRIVYDEEGPVIGVVTRVDRYTADGKESAIVDVIDDDGYEDWCGVETITEITPQRPKWWNDPVTDRQIEYLKSLGHTGEMPTTKGEASDLIDRLTPSCHYCGGKATSFGFFDEPVCKECGGR